MTSGNAVKRAAEEARASSPSGTASSDVNEAGLRA